LINWLTGSDRAKLVSKAITRININIPDVSSRILEAWYPVIHEIHRTNRPTRQALVINYVSAAQDMRNLPFLDRKAALALLLRNTEAGILEEQGRGVSSSSALPTA
jgi:hypothetical protein